MRRAMCLAILLPLIALAGSKADLMRPVTVVNDGEYRDNSASLCTPQFRLPGGDKGGTDCVGHIDTVGGTTYDFQVYGPSDEYVYADSGYGVHVNWVRSSQSSGHSDRNMGYNYYDFATRRWMHIDTCNFMNSGVNVFTIRSGFGNLDVNPITHVAYICCHQAPSSVNPVVARDAAPGAGVFTECAGTPAADGYQWPSMCLTHSEQVHVALCDAATAQGIFESDVNPWGTWSTPVAFQDTASVPGFPTYVAKGSKTTLKAVVSWEHADSAGKGEGCYRATTDDGNTWDPPVQIPSPPAYTPGSETTASFHVAGIYPYLDYGDNLHVVCVVAPIIGGVFYAMPTEVWHWFQPTGLWSRIARHQCDGLHLRGTTGYNALFANRPTLGEADSNEFICVWDVFDSLSYEPQTCVLRADVYAARSTDNGATWGPYRRLTDPDSTSKIDPSVSPRTVSDTVWVRYIQDLCSGFGIAPYGQGPVTDNPVIVQHFWKGDLPLAPLAVGGRGEDLPDRLSATASPNPFQRQVIISYDLPKSGNVRLSVCDVLGRTVRVLVNETKGPGRYSAGWDGRNGRGRTLPAGIYFCALEAEGRRLSRKLVQLP